MAHHLLIIKLTIDQIGSSKEITDEDYNNNDECDNQPFPSQILSLRIRNFIVGILHGCL